MASAIRRALRDETGDVLAFLPGIGEISRLADDLVGALGPDVDVHRLAGALALEEQDRALAPSPPGRRRVVLATDIAETSLTVDGVRVVVDSGLARAPRFDPGTGMTRLTTVSISRDSADQRAGRAGRVEPGAAYRLWSRMEHGTRPGAPAGRDHPGRPGRVRARARRVGHARRGSCRSSTRRRPRPAGRPSSCSPTSARSTRPARSRRPGGRWWACRCTRASPGWSSPGPTRCRAPWPPSSRSATCCAAAPTGCPPTSRCASPSCAATSATTAPTDGPPTGCGSGRRTSPGGPGSASTPTASTPTPPVWPSSPASPTASRRGAARPSSSCATAPGHGSPTTTRWRRAPFLVAADLDGKRTNARIRLGAAVDASEIARAARRRHRGPPAGVGRRRRRPRRARRAPPRRAAPRRGAPPPGARRGDDRGARRPGPRHPARRAALDAGLVAAAGPDRVPARHARRRVARRLRRRPARDARRVAGPVRRRGDRARRPRPARPRASCCGRCCRGRSAPTSTSSRRGRGPCPVGREAAIDYVEERPTVSVRVQDVFGVQQHPTIAGGRVPLTLSLLSPADRPIQVTADLPGFWTGSWAAVRKDLAGRYPKHRWPTDPGHEPPGPPQAALISSECFGIRVLPVGPPARSTRHAANTRMVGGTERG